VVVVVAVDAIAAGVISFPHTNTRLVSGEKHTQQRPRGTVVGRILSSSWVMVAMCSCTVSEGGSLVGSGASGLGTVSVSISVTVTVSVVVFTGSVCCSVGCAVTSSVVVAAGVVILSLALQS